ncbi:GNAT family N-acetyltransferase [Halobacillus sp. Nhm2S1]|uniref:GNAT family N-acetyltransferase n=1 Tax=Halobacillus sp. Nhm2S1 TaxID=2866716 RepID=UPI001C738A0F|nr:GNAT family N-acetyltransferase [Halobacillus sp. Nhm2S1]MBX0356823.1 GNAT family N-acetyltransferase [Halobacillus sp. Nhm2S1]
MGKGNEQVFTLDILPLHKAVEDDARNLILAGFFERFGFIDHSLNPDLKDMMGTYGKDGHVFYVAFENDEMVATGAVTKENHRVGRIERMSVKRTFRRKGIGQRMLAKLEDAARSSQYERLVLETHNTWESAVRLYTSNGYYLLSDDGQRYHFEKNLGI